MLKYIKLFFLLSFILILACCSSSSVPISQLYKDSLVVHYIDVGQGDSILIQVNNKNLLIDAGPGDSKSSTVNYLKQQGVKKLDFVVETHPHEDHIGGMSEVIRQFSIGEFYSPKVTANISAFSNMISSLKAKNLKINIAKAGISINLGTNVNLDFLGPCSDNYNNDLNLYSSIIKLTYKESKFLFMGDAQAANEAELLSKNFDVSCDVLKVGHHGSKTSSAKAFIDKAMPGIAVISVGKGNDYGHPNKETLKTLKAVNCLVYRTDLNGSVVLISDGKNIIRKK